MAYRSGNAKILNPPLTSHKSQATPPTFIYQYYTSNVSQHEKEKKDVFFFEANSRHQDIYYEYATMNLIIDSM